MYAEGTRNTAGPLLIHTLANHIGHARLGLSVPRRVGNAIVRNTIKRRCREAFRNSLDTLPNDLDILITVRPHEPMKMQEYASLLYQGVST